MSNINPFKKTKCGLVKDSTLGTVIATLGLMSCQSWTQTAKNIKDLKMIGKDFVLFKTNSSPSAFYIIKPACIVNGY